MNVRFGRYIRRVHANKSRLKIWDKMERGRIQGLPKIFEYPLLSQERIKLRTSNLAGIFRASMRTKAGRIGSVGESRDSPNFLVPPLSQEWVKLRTSNLADIFRGAERAHTNKSRSKVWEKLERGRIQGLSKFFEYPLLSQERIKLELQIWQVYSQGPSEQKPFKNLRENGAWAYRETVQIF